MAAPSVFTAALRCFAPAGMPAPLAGALGRILHLEHLDTLYASVPPLASPAAFAHQLLRQIELELRVAPGDLNRIPRRGPTVIVANHPFGLIEGLATVTLLERIRPDVKILANHLLGAVPELRERLILIDPFDAAAARHTNSRGLREALAWLSAGGLLVVFPAGEVAHLNLRRIGIQDPPWHPTAVRLLQRSGATAVPLYFSGKNSALFQVAGLVHPRLRTALLPHELWNKRGVQIEVRIGHPIPAARLSPDATRATDALRRRVEWLGRRIAPTLRFRHLEPIAVPTPTEWVAAEIDALPPTARLAAQGGYEVWQVEAAQAPLAIREIGRLRETVFRAAGEGTGRALDLDSFDQHYIHLVLWRRDERRIAGAYRLAPTDLPDRQLYTRTLFRFSPRFWDHLGPALELGRSFIRLEDQRSFQALYLLWRAIGEYIVRHPQYLTLLGPVSISNHYQPASRALLARWLSRQASDPSLAALVRPRRPYLAPKQSLRLPAIQDFDELDSWLRDLEPDGKGVPVLLRHYLRMGGRIASLHVDRAFSETLDALIVVDLRQADRRALAKYFGPERADRILTPAHQR